MYTINMPIKATNKITVAPMDPWQVRRGRRSHRGGSGTHHDRRSNRFRTRGDRMREAMGEE